MGVGFYVRAIDHDEARAWLREHGLQVPTEPSREAELADLLAVANEMADLGFRIERRDTDVGFDLDIMGPDGKLTTLWIRNGPDDFSWKFHKGDWEVNLLMTRFLAQRCGPQMVFDDSECAPRIVSSGTDIKDLLKYWGDSS